MCALSNKMNDYNLFCLIEFDLIPYTPKNMTNLFLFKSSQLECF